VFVWQWRVYHVNQFSDVCIDRTWKFAPVCDVMAELCVLEEDFGEGFEVWIGRWLVVLAWDVCG
jgi:hypothetical protein